MIYWGGGIGNKKSLEQGVYIFLGTWGSKIQFSYKQISQLLWGAAPKPISTLAFSVSILSDLEKNVFSFLAQG